MPCFFFYNYYCHPIWSALYFDYCHLFGFICVVCQDFLSCIMYFHFIAFFRLWSGHDPILLLFKALTSALIHSPSSQNSDFWFIPLKICLCIIPLSYWPKHPLHSLLPFPEATLWCTRGQGRQTNSHAHQSTGNGQTRVVRP